MKIRITVGVDERYYKDEDEVVSALKKHPMTRRKTQMMLSVRARTVH